MVGSPHVLVVDDANVDRLLATRVLNFCNIQTTSVASVEEALEFLSMENDVDMILTDCCFMGGMSGYDLVREVKGSPVLKHIPVVVVFTDEVMEDIRMYLEAGADMYFFKPVTIYAVLQIMRCFGFI